MKHLFVSLLLALLAITASAGELIIHTVSYHSNYNTPGTEVQTRKKDGETYTYYWTYPGYNNYNWGIGYRTDDGYEVGAYYNSYRNLSVYVAKSWMYNEYIGVYLGLATGYNDAINFPVAPLAGLVLQLPLTSSVTAKLLLSPPLGSNLDGVAHLAFGYKF